MDLPPVPSPPGSMLVNVMSVVDQVTSTVPLPATHDERPARRGAPPTASPCSRSCRAASTGSNPRGSASSPCGRAPTSTPSPPPWRLSSATTAPARASPFMEDPMPGVGRESVEEKTARAGAQGGRQPPRVRQARRHLGHRHRRRGGHRHEGQVPVRAQATHGMATAPSPTPTPPRTRPRSSTSKRTSPRSSKRSTRRCSSPRRRPRRRRRRTRGTRCPQPWAACLRRKTKRVRDGANVPVPPPSAVMGASAVDDVAVETKTIEEVVAKTNVGGGGEGGGGGGVGGDRRGTAGVARAHVGKARRVIDFGGGLDVSVTPTPSPRGAPRVLICTSTMISVVRGDRGGYFSARGTRR